MADPAMALLALVIGIAATFWIVLLAVVALSVWRARYRYRHPLLWRRSFRNWLQKWRL